jgi:hypothetical protein
VVSVTDLYGRILGFLDRSPATFHTVTNSLDVLYGEISL